MNTTCKQCGNSREGEKYTFYHSHKAGETYSQLGSRHTKVTTHYSNIAEETYAICNTCLWKRIIKNAFFIIGIIMAAIIIWQTEQFIIRKFELWGNSAAGLVGLLIFAILLVSIVFGFTFLPLNKRDVGERIAIDIGRKEFPNSDAFFNTKDFNNLSR